MKTMQLEQWHLDYVKSLVEDKIYGIEGTPRYNYNDRSKVLKVDFLVNFERPPLIFTNFVLKLLEKGLYVIWCGMENKNTFQIAICTADEADLFA